MKNTHIIFEKTAEYEPYDFAKVNTVALIWQLFFEYKVLPLLKADICLNTTF